MRAIYEVRLEVDPAILPEFQTWLVSHMPEVVKAGGFVNGELYREESETGSIVLVSQYHAKSVEDIHDYIAHKSAPLRADGLQRFGGKFRAQRRILTFVT